MTCYDMIWYDIARYDFTGMMGKMYDAVHGPLDAIKAATGGSPYFTPGLCLPELCNDVKWRFMPTPGLAVGDAAPRYSLMSLSPHPLKVTRSSPGTSSELWMRHRWLCTRSDFCRKWPPVKLT